MSWWAITLVVIVGMLLVLVVGGPRLLLPLVMSACLTTGLSLVLTQGGWQVVVGTGMVGAGVSYAFVTLTFLAIGKDGRLR